MNLRKIFLPLLALLVAQIASATTRTVSNLNDSGPGSLRDTIGASVNGDTITFSVTGTITLNSAELAIGRNLTIVGPAGGLTVSGNYAFRVFNILPGSSVSISGLGVAFGASLNAPDDSGGGIANSGTLRLNNCEFTGNWAGFFGGAIWNGGILTVNNGAFYENKCIDNDGEGGGIENDETATVNNCTFFGNSCGNLGGGISSRGSLIIQSSTLSGNISPSGGGIASSEPGAYFYSVNTIIAGNSANDGDVYGFVTSQGHNLIGRRDGSSGWVASDLTGTTAAPLNPLLGFFDDHGGLTLTMLLLPGSAAIDAGDDSAALVLATDQRGRQRKIGTHVDIGAVEVGPVTFVVQNANDSGPGSLRQAISDASRFDFDTITFAPSVTSAIPLTSGELAIGKGLAIHGPGANVLTISGNSASRVFHVTGGESLIENLRIANGHTTGGGGGILIDGGTLDLDYSTVADCYAQGVGVASAGGGGIAVLGTATLVMVASTLSGNTTPYYGGGIYLFNGAHANLRNSTVSGNRTLDGFNDDAWGGGIFVGNSSTLNVFACTVANNSSATAAGGVYKGLSGTVTAGNSLIAGNSAPGGPDCKGTFVSNGYNLIGNASGSTGFSATGDQVNLNPLIGPLADNGGGTLTHALLTGSPAIDKGKGFGVLTTDQRGRPRPFDLASIANASGGDGSDIGAFEVNPQRLSIVHAGSKVVVTWPASDIGYTLEAKPNLNASSAWTAVPGTVVVGSQNTLTVTAPTGNKLYRLRRP